MIKLLQHKENWRYCTFVPLLLLLMTHHEKKAAESFTVALTLTLGGWGGMKVQ